MRKRTPERRYGWRMTVPRVFGATSSTLGDSRWSWWELNWLVDEMERSGQLPPASQPTFGIIPPPTRALPCSRDRVQREEHRSVPGGASFDENCVMSQPYPSVSEVE